MDKDNKTKVQAQYFLGNAPQRTELEIHSSEQSTKKVRALNHQSKYKLYLFACLVQVF